jgi:hypothetical protein
MKIGARRPAPRRRAGRAPRAASVCRPPSVSTPRAPPLVPPLEMLLPHVRARPKAPGTPLDAVLRRVCAVRRPPSIPHAVDPPRRQPLRPNSDHPSSLGELLVESHRLPGREHHQLAGIRPATPPPTVEGPNCTSLILCRGLGDKFHLL